MEAAQDSTESNWRGIGLDLDPAVRDPDLTQPLCLVLSQHLKRVDAAPPEAGKPEQSLQGKAALPALSDQTFEVEVHDAVDQPPSQHRVQRRDEMKH